MAERKPYRKRYEKKPFGNTRLTADDRALIKHVYDHRFLESKHVFALFPDRSPQKLRGRLAKLTHAGYLDRPKAQQIRHYQIMGQGSLPLVYAVGLEGAKVLEHHYGIPRGRVQWKQKNRQVGQDNIEHTLRTSDIMVAFYAALKNREGYIYLDQDAILALAPEDVQKEKTPFAYRERVSIDGTIREMPVRPDAVFGYEQERNGKQFRIVCLVETDRATMPVTRTDLDKSSILKKYVGYLSTLKRVRRDEPSELMRRFPANWHVVMTVTTVPSRVQAMIKALPQAQSVLNVKLEPQRFLFAVQDDVGVDTVFSDIWTDGSGKRLSIH